MEKRLWRMEMGYAWAFNYRETKTTLLFLHELGGTAANFAELAALLSAKYKILAVNLPSRGESTFIKMGRKKPYGMGKKLS